MLVKIEWVECYSRKGGREVDEEGGRKIERGKGRNKGRRDGGREELS
jgi:hypothetical protein